MAQSIASGRALMEILPGGLPNPCRAFAAPVPNRGSSETCTMAFHAGTDRAPVKAGQIECALLHPLPGAAGQSGDRRGIDLGSLPCRVREASGSTPRILTGERQFLGTPYLGPTPGPAANIASLASSKGTNRCARRTPRMAGGPDRSHAAVAARKAPPRRPQSSRGRHPSARAPWPAARPGAGKCGRSHGS